MEQPKQLTRQAYIDQELSVDQTVALKEALSDEELAELEAESQFESELASRLGADVPCPDEVWHGIRRRLQAEQRSPATWQWVGSVRTVMRLAAAVAIVAIGLALWTANRSTTDHGVAALPESPAALARLMEIHGDYDKISAALAGHGFYVKVSAPDPEQYHPVELLGLRFQQHNGQEVAEIAFACCGKPVVVYISSKQSGEWAIGSMPRELPERWFMGGREVDTYKIMAVSPHGTEEVLDLFS